MADAENGGMGLMADTRIAEFTALKCDCGGELFATIVKLKFKTDGGTISEPAGHWCVACHAVVDPRYMRQLVDRRLKVDEIKRLQAEVAEPVEAPAAKVTVKA